MNIGLMRFLAKPLFGTIVYALVSSIPFHSANAADFPGTGHKFIADLKKFRFEQSYTSASSLTYTALNPDGSRGASSTVSVRAQEVANSVFMITWQEADKTTVVQIHDYGKHIIYSNLTFPDGTFVQLEGTLTPAD
jgi:hypothetical protein